MFSSARLLLDNLNSLGLRSSCTGIDPAHPIQRPNDACQFRIDQGQRDLINGGVLKFATASLKLSRTNDTYRSKMITILRVEGRVTLQPSVAVRDDDFCVWIRW